MPTTKRNRSSDRSRVSSEKHEISYAARKLGKGRAGAASVREAKRSLGRKTSRPAVMAKAKGAAPKRPRSTVKRPAKPESFITPAYF